MLFMKKIISSSTFLKCFKITLSEGTTVVLQIESVQKYCNLEYLDKNDHSEEPEILKRIIKNTCKLLL